MNSKQGLIRNLSYLLNNGRNRQGAIAKSCRGSVIGSSMMRDSAHPASSSSMSLMMIQQMNVGTIQSTLPTPLRLFWKGDQRLMFFSCTPIVRRSPLSVVNSRFKMRPSLAACQSSTLSSTSSSTLESSTSKMNPIHLQKQFFHSTLPSHEKDEQKEEPHHTKTSDPPILTWYDPYTPAWMGPYLRLARVDKPIGTWLLLWPCLWSTAMAASNSAYLLPDPYLCSLFAVGSFVMRGSGCTINDLWDQDFDKQVTRTKARPLASGELNSTQAIQFLALQLLVGLGVLTSLPNMEYCFWWGASSLPLVVIYPLMKRFTNFPQVVLGLTFNWGAWMGWAATFGSMNYSVIAPLYLSGVCWTVVYDTIYANQDKDDDKAIGLKSTALTFGEDESRHKQILHGFAALTFVQWLAAGYMMEDISMIPYSMGMSAAYSHLLWQIQTAELDNPQNLADRFRSNTVVGGIVFASIVAGKVL